MPTPITKGMLRKRSGLPIDTNCATFGRPPLTLPAEGVCWSYVHLMVPDWRGEALEPAVKFTPMGGIAAHAGIAWAAAKASAIMTPLRAKVLPGLIGYDPETDACDTNAAGKVRQCNLGVVREGKAHVHRESGAAGAVLQNHGCAMRVPKSFAVQVPCSGWAEKMRLLRLRMSAASASESNGRTDSAPPATARGASRTCLCRWSSRRWGANRKGRMLR